MLVGRTNRRAFIAALGGAAAWPLTARAQNTTKPVIGYLSSLSLGDSANQLAGGEGAMPSGWRGARRGDRRENLLDHRPRSGAACSRIVRTAAACPGPYGRRHRISSRPSSFARNALIAITASVAQQEVARFRPAHSCPAKFGAAKSPTSPSVRRHRGQSRWSRPGE